MDKKYKYELHCHCSEISPCGQLSATETAALYKQAGYDGIVLTDHFRRDIIELLDGNTWEEKVNSLWKPYRELKKRHESSDFFIGRGLEIRFDNNDNDILVYGFTDELFLREGERWTSMGLPAFYEKYKNRMLLIQAHPNRKATTYPEPLDYLHGIEVKNTSPRNDNYNEITEQTVKENPWLIATGGSDCHRVEDVAGSGILCT
ncbi:MAG: PHP domain-containing protein, partial [Lachnospiraceae bacterium]